MLPTENRQMHREEPSSRSVGCAIPDGWRFSSFGRWLEHCYLRHRLDPASAPSGLNPLVEFAGSLTCFYPWILLGPLVFRLEYRFPLNREKGLINFPILTFFG